MDAYLRLVLSSYFLGYLLQTAQSWANAGVTEDCHCQGACRQWFFYVPTWDGTDINVILRFTSDTQSPMLWARFWYHNCRFRKSNPCGRRQRRPHGFDPYTGSCYIKISGVSGVAGGCGNHYTTRALVSPCHNTQTLSPPCTCIVHLPVLCAVQLRWISVIGICIHLRCLVSSYCLKILSQLLWILRVLWLVFRRMCDCPPPV